MQITVPHYPDFADSTDLEELLLQLAMKIFDIQKDALINTENTDIITIDQALNAETTTISCTGWAGNWVGGVFTVKNFFPSFTFAAGVGAYPFNRVNICDAFFHVAMFQQKQELTTAKNPGKVNFIDWAVSAQATIGTALQGDISLDITDLPISIQVQADQTVIKAKPYLS